MNKNVELLTKVTETLKNREETIKTLNQHNEEITSLCRTLLDCVKQSMRNRPNGLGYDEKQKLQLETRDLCIAIDNIEFGIVEEEVFDANLGEEALSH